MRPSLNGLDETRRANQSDSREAASSARNVFDVARFTIYNKTPNYWLSASYKQPGLVWRKGRGGVGVVVQKYEALQIHNSLVGYLGRSDGGW